MGPDETCTTGNQYVLGCVALVNHATFLAMLMGFQILVLVLLETSTFLVFAL